jgi:hypothetical protein
LIFGIFEGIFICVVIVINMEWKRRSINQNRKQVNS